MAGFLYFIADRMQPMTLAHLPEDLQPQFKGASLERGTIPKGPQGGPGELFCVSGSRERLGVNKETQTWVEVKGSHWIGFDNSDRPTPKDLQRTKLVSGTPVELGDGNQWVIPAVLVGRNTLPKAYRLINGELTLVPLGGYEEITEEATEWFDVMTKMQIGESVTYKPGDLFRFVAMVLSINYRVSEIELGCGTDIITNSDQLIVDVLHAAFGITDLVEEMELKKKAGTLTNGCDLSPGEKG